VSKEHMKNKEKRYGERDLDSTGFRYKGRKIEAATLDDIKVE